MQIEKLVDTAIDLRIATLKAKEKGIIGISGVGTETEAFQFYDEEDFKKMIKDKEYTIEQFNHDYKYEYSSIISGLKFFCLSKELLFENDENKIQEDKNEGI